MNGRLDDDNQARKVRSAELETVARDPQVDHGGQVGRNSVGTGGDRRGRAGTGGDRRGPAGTGVTGGDGWGRVGTGEDRRGRVITTRHV